MVGVAACFAKYIFDGIEIRPKCSSCLAKAAKIMPLCYLWIHDKYLVWYLETMITAKLNGISTAIDLRVKYHNRDGLQDVHI